MKKMLIMDDNLSMLKLLKKNITEFEVITAKEIDVAVDIIIKCDIDFFVVDLNLGYSTTGEISYDKLFQIGKSIPAIVLTGQDLPRNKKTDLRDMGFSKIISKHGIKSISEIIEMEAKRILDDCDERIRHIRSNMNLVDSKDQNLEYKSQKKTIGEWIKEMAECKHEKDENELRQLIIDIINVHRVRSDDYKFKN